MNRNLGRTLAVVAVAAATFGSTLVARAQTVVTIGIGTQDTTTNTVTAGVIIRQLNLLTKYLPKDGKYANVKFEFEWNNFTSGPPVTNGMMANKLQFGMMGDYPLVVNGFTFQNNPESKSRLIAVAAYNRFGSGNGIVVHKDSSYFELSDLSRDRLQKLLDQKARSLSRSVVSHLRWDLNAIFKMAAEDSIVEGNPAGSLVTPKEAKTRAKRVMTKEQVRLALSVLDLRERVIFLLAVLVGMIQILIALLKLGDLTRYISESVIIGFLTGAGVLIALGQLPSLLGLQQVGGGDLPFLQRLWLTLSQGGAIDGRALGIGLGAVACPCAASAQSRRRQRP